MERNRKAKIIPGEGFRCATCGKWHEGLPFDYGFDSPLYWDELSKEQKAHKSSFLNSDVCVIRGEHFFVRGIIEIQVRDASHSFCWGVWVSLSQKNFDRAMELWNDPLLLKEEPYFGWLSTRIDGYPDTLGLKTNVSYRNLDDRPYVELEPTDHPLAVEQRKGITLGRVREIAARALHQPTIPGVVARGRRTRTTRR